MNGKVVFACCLLLMGLNLHGFSQENQLKPKSKVDYKGFTLLTQELEAYRNERLISIDAFNDMAKDAQTIILDTRSKAAFDQVHVTGAIHLNFSDFTDEKLAKIIPSKHTRILIYCNNNFESPKAALMSKRAPLALNIPTFINLYGYGYKNIYELDDYLDEKDPRVILSVANNQQKPEKESLVSKKGK